jgi:hypothetical protein
VSRARRYFFDRATCFRFLLSTRFRLAVVRFTFDRFATFRLERFPLIAAMQCTSCAA